MIKYTKWFIAITLIAGACFFFLKQRGNHTENISYNLFREDSGWGYNILMNDNIVIHQDRIPVIPEYKVFNSKEQAKTAAQLVISKIKAKKAPTFGKDEIEKIILPKK